MEMESILRELESSASDSKNSFIYISIFTATKAFYEEIRL